MKYLFPMGLLALFLFAFNWAKADTLNPTDWPSWRGPSANGVAPASAKPPLKWSESTNIKWKAPLPGKGSATPVVIGDQVIVLSSVQTERVATAEELPKPDTRFETKTTPPNRFYRFQVTSFDRENGMVRWQQTATEAVPHEGHHPTHSYAAGSPVTDGERIYASFGSFGIYAYNLKGELTWKRDLGRMRTRLGWGEAVTPVLHGNDLILNWDQEVDSKLIVLDKASGKTRLEIKRDEKTSWNAPAIIEKNGKTQVILNGTNRIRSYNLADGSPLWEVGGMTVNAIPSPLVDKNTAYIVSGYRGASAVAIQLDAQGEQGDKSDKILWRYGKGTPYVPSPILVDGRLYMTKVNTPFLTVLDASTGKPLVEDMRLPKATSFYGSPIVAQGKLYFADRDGNTVIVSATEKPTVLATNSLQDHFDASPALSGRTLFLRGEKFLYAIEEPVSGN